MAYADREDQRAYTRKHYQDNKELYKTRARESNARQRKARQEHVRALKESTPCADCGVQYPYWVMDFDHILDDKLDGVAKLVKAGPMKRLLAEIEKCEVVCANCHRTRTYARLVE